MLTHKACHPGLRARTRFLGLEPVDALMLFPGLFVCVVLLKQLVLGVVITLLTALVIRLLKWGRLPGYTVDLAVYLLLPRHLASLGRDTAPLYPGGGV